MVETIFSYILVYFIFEIVESFSIQKLFLLSGSLPCSLKLSCFCSLFGNRCVLPFQMQSSGLFLLSSLTFRFWLSISNQFVWLLNFSYVCMVMERFQFLPASTSRNQNECVLYWFNVFERLHFNCFDIIFRMTKKKYFYSISFFIYLFLDQFVMLLMKVRHATRIIRQIVILFSLGSWSSLT